MKNFHSMLNKRRYLSGFKKIIGDVTVALNLDGRELCDMTRTVRIRVSYRSVSRMYSTHCSMTTDEYTRFQHGQWDNKDACENIMFLFDRYCKVIRKLEEADEFSFESLNNLLGKGVRNSLQDLISHKIKNLESKGKIGTAITYKDLLAAVNRFSGNKEISMSAIDKNWCIRFMDDLKTHGNVSTTISIRLRGLSSIMNDAVKRYLAKRNPVKDISIPPSARKVLDVGKEDLKRLLDTSLIEIGENDYIHLQYWKALYYGNGMDLTDLLHLKWRDMYNGMIVFERRKTLDRTPRPIRIPISQMLNDCFNTIIKLKGKGKQYILPDMEDVEPGTYKEKARISQIAKNINSALRRICEFKGIKSKITTHSARHIFATKNLQAGAPIEFISFAMGHSNIRTTMNYLEGYTDEQLRQYAAMMNKYIHSQDN